MACPMFINDTRKCITEIKSIPVVTYDFCSSEKYTDCPFFRVPNKIGHTCENIKNCYLYAHFKMKDFKESLEITKKYRLSENNVKRR